MNAITVEKLNAPNREMLGAVVRIRGLTGEQEDANGLEGVAEQFDMLKQHFHVKLDDKRMKLPGWRKGEAKVSESNLELVEGSAAFDDPALAALVALAGVDANAPPKRAAAAASSKAKKPRSSAPPEPDWRTPLFFWRGEVSNGTSWSGTWVASADGLPSDADFAASANTFTLSCSENISTMSDGPSGTADAPAATLTGSYKGDGQEDISDTEHSICVQEGPAMGGPMGDSGWLSVAGRGTNRFGKFLSLGTMVRTNDGEHDPHARTPLPSGERPKVHDERSEGARPRQRRGRGKGHVGLRGAVACSPVEGAQELAGCSASPRLDAGEHGRGVHGRLECGETRATRRYRIVRTEHSMRHARPGACLWFVL